ncbi:MAG: DsrE family protein [Candidatus Bathyarchaeota archaeon]|nr:DsrE family protein [Candidatus Bathyarchaeota archaeon]
MGRMLILLCESPFQNEGVEHAIEIAESALEKGHLVDIYLMMDGVYGPIVTQSGEPFNMDSVSDRFKTLMKKGANISGCRVCMELRGVNEDHIPDGMDIGGIFDLSENLSEADVVLSMVGAD